MKWSSAFCQTLEVCNLVRGQAMTSIAAMERATYSDVWELEPYKQAPSAGLRYSALFTEFARPGETVLDAGCGDGRGAMALAAHGLHVTTCDITSAGLPPVWPLEFEEAALWHDLADVFGPHGFDWVYCCDVLQHVPVQFTMTSVAQLVRQAHRGVFLSVSTQPDPYGIWIGKNLHQTVQGFTWWRDSLREFGPLVEARDLVGSCVFVLNGGAA